MIFMEQPALNLSLLSNMIEQSFTRIMQVMVCADLWSNTYDFQYSLFEILKGRLEKKQQSTKKAVFRIKKQSLVKF